MTGGGAVTDDDLLIGGAGEDGAVYKGNSANFTIVQNGDGSVTITDTVGNEGIDTLIDMEVAVFNDQTIDLGLFFA